MTDRTKKLQRLTRACEMTKPAGLRWDVIQNSETGNLVGSVGPDRNGKVNFVPDGAQYTLSSQALREIADLIDAHGLELAS